MSPTAALEVRSALPRADKAVDAPPLLFVHGAYCDAWCWDAYMLPWFAAAGYAAHALSLRGHGKSPGRDDLGSLHLADYVDDIRGVVAALPAPPILIGHSMGAALVERMIAETAFPGAALLSPVPPSGLLPVLTRLWWGRPEFFWQAQNLHHHFNPVSASTLREFYFTKNATREILMEVMRHLSPESPQAVMELAWRGHSRPSDERAGDTPVCVITGGQDALFTPGDASATARRYQIEPIVLEGLPHMMMLEPGWESLALTLRDWISQLRRTPDAKSTPRRPAAKARAR